MLVSRIFLLVVIVLLFGACHRKITGVVSSAAEYLEIPCKEGAQPNLYTSASGEVYLSWVEYLDDSTDALMYARMTEVGEWSSAREIARGTDWFVNWADFPSLIAFGERDRYLAAHWLEKRAAGVYDYDVHVAVSRDGGVHWGASFIPHRDGVAAEHGFVKMQPVGEDQFVVVWLDGRFTKKAGGAMTLRTARFDVAGTLVTESELDDRVCDCCQTDLVPVGSDFVVVYRDRSEAEIRDVFSVRGRDAVWTAPQAVCDDGWMIAGCPVNGPAVDALGEQVVVAWFGMVEGIPEVKLAFSSDGGRQYGDPVRIDNGGALGRVDVVLLEENVAVVSWMESDAEQAAIRLAKVSADGRKSSAMLLAQVEGSRQSGFPRITRYGEQLIAAWTSIDQGGKAQVKTKRIDLRELKWD